MKTQQCSSWNDSIGSHSIVELQVLKNNLSHSFNRRLLEKTSCVVWVTDFDELQCFLRRSLWRFWFKCWCTNKMFKISTMSKNLRIPRLEKIGFEGVLGALNVINLSAAFWSVRIRWEFVLSWRPHIWQL